MSFLSIRELVPYYISYYEKRGVVYLSYNHSLFSIHGITLKLSDISVSTENSLIKIHIHSDKSRSMMKQIESHILIAYPRMYPILNDDSLCFPYNQITSKFANKIISEGYITLKHLRETYEKRYKPIIHFHLKF